MSDYELIYSCKGAIYDVYNELGPGLLENVYKQALAYEISERGLQVEIEKPIPVIFKDQKLEHGYRADLIIENKLIIEIKSVDEIARIHHLQLMTYLKLSEIPHGILVNFNTADIKKNIFYWDSKKIVR